MKTLFITLLLFTSASFASEAPGAYYVAASILKDSGINDASQVSGTHVGTERFGSEDQTTHILRFNRGSRSFTCDYIFRASQLTSDHFAVIAEVSNCSSESGQEIQFNNDYTNENGVVVFERLFFNNNRQFRPLNSEERERFERRSGRTFRDSRNIRLVNPQNSERLILINEGQLIPIN